MNMNCYYLKGVDSTENWRKKKKNLLNIEIALLSDADNISIYTIFWWAVTHLLFESIIAIISLSSEEISISWG